MALYIVAFSFLSLSSNIIHVTIASGVAFAWMTSWGFGVGNSWRLPWLD